MVARREFNVGKSGYLVLLPSANVLVQHFGQEGEEKGWMFGSLCDGSPSGWFPSWALEPMPMPPIRELPPVQQWYETDEAKAIKAYEHDIIRWTKELITIQVWCDYRDRNIVGRKLRLTSGLGIQLRSSEIILRTSPHISDMPVSSPKKLSSGQQVQALAYTKDFVLISTTLYSMDAHDEVKVFGWISASYVGGPLGHHKFNDTLLVEPPWQWGWWLGCTEEAAREFDHLTFNVSELSVEFRCCTYEDMEPLHRQAMGKSLRASIAKSTKTPGASVEELLKKFETSGRYVYCCLRIKDCIAVRLQDWEFLQSSMPELCSGVAVKSYHHEGCMGLHISLFYLHTTEWPEHWEFDRKIWQVLICRCNKKTQNAPYTYTRARF